MVRVEPAALRSRGRPRGAARPRSRERRSRREGERSRCCACVGRERAMGAGRAAREGVRPGGGGRRGTPQRRILPRSPSSRRVEEYGRLMAQVETLCQKASEKYEKQLGTTRKLRESLEALKPAVGKAAGSPEGERVHDVAAAATAMTVAAEKTLESVNEMLPSTGSLFMRFFLGRVNVRLPLKRDKEKFRDEYNKFKSRTNVGAWGKERTRGRKEGLGTRCVQGRGGAGDEEERPFVDQHRSRSLGPRVRIRLLAPDQRSSSSRSCGRSSPTTSSTTSSTCTGSPSSPTSGSCTTTSRSRSERTSSRWYVTL